jgi:hypothetical protein
MTRNFILAGLLATFAITAQAQKVIVFNSSGTSHHKKKETGKNSVTIGMLSWFNGYTSLYYERRVTPFLSLQIGAGPTFRSLGNDFGQIVYSDGVNSDHFNNTGYDITDHYENYKYRKTGLGYYISFAPKFYFADNCMDGFYLSPCVSTKRFNYTVRPADETIAQGSYFLSDDDNNIARSTAKMKEHMNCFDLTINIGGHFQARNHMVFSWDIGWGVRSFSANRLDIGAVSDGNSIYWSNQQRNYSAVRPLMLFDIKLGGWF